MKVLVVDDHPIVVSGCRALLVEEGVCEVVATHNAAEAVQAYAALAPDIAIIDINLPDMSGFDLTRRLVSDQPDARILVFSMNDDPIFAARAIDSGAKGYISKNDDPGEFRKAVEAVAAGGTYLRPGLAEKVSLLRSSNENGPLDARLTPRDIEILRQLTKGRSMSEIAGLINVSYKTVASLCAAMRMKLNARTQAELVRIAVEQHLV